MPKEDGDVAGLSRKALAPNGVEGIQELAHTDAIHQMRQPAPAVYTVLAGLV